MLCVWNSEIEIMYAYTYHPLSIVLFNFSDDIQFVKQTKYVRASMLLCISHLNNKPEQKSLYYKLYYNQ